MENARPLAPRPHAGELTGTQAPVRAVLLDLDGTITDRNGAIARIAQRFTQRFGADLAPCPPDTVAVRMNELDLDGYRPREDFFAQLLKALPWVHAPEVGRIADFWNNQFPRCTMESPGAVEAIRRLHERGLKLGMVTNGRTDSQKGKIKTLGIGAYFSTIVISEAVGCTKPDPRIFQMAMKALHVSPEETWFVGDHPLNDIAGARALGMKAIWMGEPSEWPEGLAPPAHTIRGLLEVVELVNR